MANSENWNGLRIMRSGEASRKKNLREMNAGGGGRLFVRWRKRTKSPFLQTSALLCIKSIFVFARF